MHFDFPAHPSFRSLPPAGKAAVLLLASMLALASICAFLLWFYPAFFHSDSAAHQVLARAMLDDASLLPKDFAYGNQLILWRNNLFIAPALALGFEGYRAYAVGSALAFTLAFLVAFLCIDTLLSDWRRTLVATWLLFLPLGHSEADFVLGQQSHLAAVLLALVISVQAFRATQAQKWATTLCCVAVFMLVVEAPTRGAMLLLPLAVAVWASGRAATARRLAFAIGGTAVVAYAVNRWLVHSHQVTGISDLPMAGYAHFMDRANQLAKGLVDFFFGFNLFTNHYGHKRNLVLYGMKSLALAAFLGAAIWFAFRLVRRAFDVEQRNAPASALEFIGLVALAGGMLGFWIVSVLEYWLDIRHFLWAIVLLKFVLIVAALSYLPRGGYAGAGGLAAACIAGILMSSAAVTMLLREYSEPLRPWFEKNVQLPLVAPMKARMKELGIHRIYGDHWSTLRVEALVPGAEASVIEAEDGEIRFVNFLTRPSRKCVKGNVLYLLDRGVGPNLSMIDHVLAAGGRKLDDYSPGQALYVGPPVWKMAGCP